MNSRQIVCRVEESWTVNANCMGIEPARGENPESVKSYISEEDAKRLLDRDFSAAGQHARETLKSNPHDPQALFLLGAVLRREGHAEQARAILQPLVDSQRHLGMAWHELGLTLAELGERNLAINALLRAIDLGWMNKDAWFALGDLLTFRESARIGALSIDPQLANAETAYQERRFQVAESAVRDFLQANPESVRAIKLLADILLHTGRWNELKPVLERCLELAPDFTAARFRYVTMLFTHKNFLASLPEIDELLKSDPGNTLYRALKALALMWSRQFDRAIAEFESFIGDCDSQPGLWLEYARSLRAVKRKDAIAAYKRVFQILPSFVVAYVSLADSKSIPIDESVVDGVLSQLACPDLGGEDRAKLHFVLGRAFEDLGRYEESFNNYRRSNEILATGREYGIDDSNDYLRRSKALFQPAFFRARLGAGCPDRGPIFIVGMPRAGSTLVEQIISSHSAVEALGELDYLRQVARRLVAERPDDPMGIYPYSLIDLDADRFRMIGEKYMEAVRPHRKLGRPLFTDKMPSNRNYVGLIHLALPNAKIIDARRHPLDCCFSCFKHYFPEGHPLSMDLNLLGRLYANYVELMAHFDEVLPGRVHRVIYEHLINNFEMEVRRLFDYLELPFEEKCLRFHENERTVITLSADQVRMPLYTTGMEQWRHYEQWLGPLKEGLGYVLDTYPEAPKYYPEVNVNLTGPLSLGNTGSRFNLVKGLQQLPFEIASQSSALCASGV